METIAKQIKETVLAAKNNLEKISEDSSGYKEAPNKWSKKEILGHLIDSALNNHQRFVRAAYDAAGDFPGYNQDLWVAIQHYNERSWNDLIELFTISNIHLCNTLNHFPEDGLQNKCNFGRHGIVPIEFVAEDYLRHLKHHIEKIIN